MLFSSSSSSSSSSSIEASVINHAKLFELQLSPNIS